METVGARELKTRLGTYLRRVREGLTLIITDRGRPVAELRPLAEAAYSEDEAWLELAAKGIVTLGTGRLQPRTPVKIAGGSLADQIIEDREDRI
jgi:prevent-host-death family protein